MLDHALDSALRSPLDRIIDAADEIVDRNDGPLRSDYANYATDIAAAGRHLLSVIQSMGKDAAAVEKLGEPVEVFVPDGAEAIGEGAAGEIADAVGQGALEGTRRRPDRSAPGPSRPHN